MIASVLITLAMVLGIMIHGGQIARGQGDSTDNFGNAVLMALELMVIVLVWIR